MAESQAHQSGGRWHDRVVVIGVELGEPGVEVAAQCGDSEVGPQRQQLRDASQAGGSDQSAARQGGDVVEPIGDERITRILALQHRGQLEAVGQMHGHVLERVNGQVRVAALERQLEFLDEQALAANLGQRAIEDLVAARRHAQQR